MTAWMPPAWYRSSMWCVPAGAMLADVRHLGGDLVDALQVEVEARLGGDGREVEHGVGAAAQVASAARALPTAASVSDVARLQVGGEHLHDLARRLSLARRMRSL